MVPIAKMKRTAEDGRNGDWRLQVEVANHSKITTRLSTSSKKKKKSMWRSFAVTHTGFLCVSAASHRLSRGSVAVR